MAASAGGGADDPEAEPAAATPYTPTKVYLPETLGYDPAEAREDMRGHIARVLVWALVLFLGFALLSSWIHIVPENRAALLDVLQLIIGPMIGLVGAAVGFYFGEKSR